MSTGNIDAKDCLSTVIFAQEIIAHTIADLDSAEKNKTPLYNLDFSVLIGVLFDRKEFGVSSFLPDARAVMSHILGEHDHTEPYILGISGTVYYEFLDQLVHILDSVEGFRDSEVIRNQIPNVTPDTVAALFEGKRFEQKTAELKSNLAVLTKQGREARITQPAKKLLAYLEDKKLYGIGDYLSPPLASVNLPYEFNKIFRKQVDVRLPREHSRSEADSLFHYKMDSISICLSRYYTRPLHSKMLFVTRSFANLESCKTDDDLVGRHYYVPLALKNLCSFQKDSYVRDKALFLQEALAAATSLRRKIMDEILNYRVEHLKGHLVTQYYNFYNTYYSQLMLTTHPPDRQLDSVTKDQLAEIMQSHARIKDEVDATVAEVEAVAKIVSEQVDNLGLEYLSDFDLEDDPVLARIKKRFHLD